MRLEELRVAKRTVAASRGPGNDGQKSGSRGGVRGGGRSPRPRASELEAAKAKARPAASSAGVEAVPRGAATLTDGLDSLDRERASSLADEGGTAGAVVEAQPSTPPRRRAAGKLWLAASWGLAGLAALYVRKSR
jgi:hypothetical protein